MWVRIEFILSFSSNQMNKGFIEQKLKSTANVAVATFNNNNFIHNQTSVNSIIENSSYHFICVIPISS